ncbi:spoIIIJ-associated protein [Bacillus ectoiniformans]|uniref:RNA-binding cell elongation regulator Jag/EloR n=1 Tax=Bacillus ectoiniformans TaxID=1494429 RepID=UPI00195F02B6|nr:RNA-binding cell elongation regulator Jag/EloR [Bacillus ectoiniformans]MBM7648139.1 spoIIIJ-associated protein [Bacillus ectoiniformans]
MKELTAVGPTVEDALQSALKQLKVKKEQVEVEILEEGKRGWFGLFGNREASVKVTVKPNLEEEVRSYILSITSFLGADPTIEMTRKGKQLNINLSGDKIALLIGKRGQTLNALQQLTQLVANRYSDQYIHLTLDAENYRKRREETLAGLAKRMADKAIHTKRPVHLEPLPSFERKAIHAALAKDRRINTHSEGAEPNRHIVITAR